MKRIVEAISKIIKTQKRCWWPWCAWWGCCCCCKMQDVGALLRVGVCEMLWMEMKR